MKTNFEKVQEFSEKFGLESLPHASPMIPDDLFVFRLNLILEEVTEIIVARQSRDTAKFADGIADLLYVTYGLASLCSIPIDAVFAAVHDANMRKVRATRDDDPLGKRGSAYDVVKPPGWQPANIEEVLAHAR